MRVLLDERVPRGLKRDLIGHDVHAVVDIGWSSKRNGELLQLMSAEKFEILLTVDQKLEFRQNVVILRPIRVRSAPTQRNECRP